MENKTTAKPQKIKLLTILGARPQFIKAAAISRRVKADKDQRFTEVILHTGQHFDYGMSDIFFEELKIPIPKYNLGINSKSHGAMTGEMLIKIEEVLLIEKPDYVLVYGDTNSTLAGALAAKKLLIPVIHVEAGLRSFNNTMPEETNRILTDRMSSLLFCPTANAIHNLQNEGFDNFKPEIKVVKIGDIMYDTFKFMTQSIQNEDSEMKEAEKDRFVLATIHRAENTDDLTRLKSITDAFIEIAKTIKIILPLHPRTKAVLNRHEMFKTFLSSEKIEIIDPVGYKEMVKLLVSCSLICTDSGGLQKDAYFAQKPCLTLRDETEWVELVEAGYNKIVSADQRLILAAFKDFLKQDVKFKEGLYGDGEAGVKVLEEVSFRY